jgi:hypothetical protein
MKNLAKKPILPKTKVIIEQLIYPLGNLVIFEEFCGLLFAIKRFTVPKISGNSSAIGISQRPLSVGNSAA